MIRALVVSGLALGFLALQASGRSQPSPNGSFSVVEATIPQMAAAMAEKRVTSREIVRQYLVRLAIYEDRLNAALAVNPRALDEADALDRERAAGKVRGPLHGIPVALKDNIHTTHLPTTGGALAFVGYVPPYEATLTKNLREAGAIIIAKAGLTELRTGWPGRPTPCLATTTPSAGSRSIRTTHGWTLEKRRSMAVPRWRPAARAPVSGPRPTCGLQALARTRAAQ